MHNFKDRPSQRHMPTLKDLPTLGGYVRDYGQELSIEEIVHYEMVALSPLKDKKDLFQSRIEAQLNTRLPYPNTLETCSNGYLMWLDPQTYLLFQDERNDHIDTELSERLGDCLYTVLMSDGWAGISLSGNRIHDVLERVVTLDLRQKGLNFATRTQAFHTPLILTVQPDTHVQMFVPRSYARSFLDQLCHTIDDIMM